MQAAAGKHLIPFLRRLGSEGAPLRKHMSSASYEIPTDRPLAEVVDLVSDLPMKSRDTKGDLYEYMLLKVTSAGQNGQFRKPNMAARQRLLKEAAYLCVAQATDEQREALKNAIG